MCARLARDLCDRALRERAPYDWLRTLWDPALVETQRAWVGLDPLHDWADRGALDRCCEDHEIVVAARDVDSGRRIAPHGKAAMAFKAARVAASLTPPPSLLVLSADTDGDLDPTRSLAAGLALADERAIPAVCSQIHRESEAWVVSGFVAENAAERAALARLIDELGFDPTRFSERLLSNASGDPRDAKRVARALFAPSGGATLSNPRFERCWLETPLELLLERGARSGLGAFVAEVLAIVPRAIAA